VIREQAIIEWRREAPWAADWMVEQDLIISRALVEIYSQPELARRLAFRGGTALYKLHLRPPARYSEDIDLVQVGRAAQRVGPVARYSAAYVEGRTCRSGLSLRFE
jgi:hypothetical protein